MKLEQSFEVAAPLELVWEALIDVERVAPCLPGRGGHRPQRRRQLQRHVHGQDRPDHRRPTPASSKMEEVDEASRTATMQAQGTDQRGQGGAKATIVARCASRRRRDPRRRRHRLPHHRPAGPVRARRDDRGHLRADDGRLLQCLQASIASGPAAPPRRRRPRRRRPRLRRPPRRRPPRRRPSRPRQSRPRPSRPGRRPTPPWPPPAAPPPRPPRRPRPPLRRSRRRRPGPSRRPPTRCTASAWCCPCCGSASSASSARLVGRGEK